MLDFLGCDPIGFGQLSWLPRVYCDIDVSRVQIGYGTRTKIALYSQTNCDRRYVIGLVNVAGRMLPDEFLTARRRAPVQGECPARALLKALPRWPLASLASAA